ncbi:hypothetical protein MMC25_005376 [Agyrium rufum]|nr:hypothetical protein [Agyrium rufum]
MNNDLAVSNMTKTVSSVSITAEIQTPSQTIPLDLYPKDETRSRPSLKPAETMQKSLKFDLREEGNHCLAVSLSYSETSAAEGDNRASSGKVRSFRKLYTFVARPCLAVRTKTSEIQMRDSGTDAGQSRYVLEAQVENLAEGLITLDNLTFDPQDAFQSFSINWGLLHGDQKHPDLPVLAPREVTQVVFLIEEAQGSTISAQVPVRQKQPTRDGRTILGSMGIRWRNTMGDLGTLSTGLLTTRRQ